MSTNRRPVLLVHLPGLANFREVVLRTQHRAAEPNGVPLHNILVNFTFNVSLLVVWAKLCILCIAEAINTLLKHLLQALIETFEKRRAAGKHDILVELNTVLNWARIYRIIYGLIKGLDVILVHKFLHTRHKL